jgi:hypothetical protein
MFKSVDGSAVVSRVCNAIENDNLTVASTILERDYPFAPLANVGRHYTPLQSMQVFARDGFIDRYSGRRLIFPGTLRLISMLLPREFPYQKNWKTDACHFAFYELFPTIDHLIPVSRGGADNEDNRVSTSMIRNAAKANFTIQELGWSMLPAGDINKWDGLTRWFLQQVTFRKELREKGYFHSWCDAAKKVLSA